MWPFTVALRSLGYSTARILQSKLYNCQLFTHISRPIMIFPVPNSRTLHPSVHNIIFHSHMLECISKSFPRFHGHMTPLWNTGVAYWTRLCSCFQQLFSAQVPNVIVSKHLSVENTVLTSLPLLWDQPSTDLVHPAYLTFVAILYPVFWGCAHLQTLPERTVGLSSLQKSTACSSTFSSLYSAITSPVKSTEYSECICLLCKISCSTKHRNLVVIAHRN